MKLGTKERQRFAELNDAYVGAMRKYEDAASELNDVIGRFNELRESVVENHQEEYDGKSERWQESDAGMAAHEWIEQWGEELEEISFELPSTLDERYPESVE